MMFNAAQANDDNDDDDDDDDDEQDDEFSQKSCNNSMNPDNEGVDANGFPGSAGTSKKTRVSRKKFPSPILLVRAELDLLKVAATPRHLAGPLP